MRYRKLDINSDMTFGQGGQGFLANTPETVAQAVVTSLRLFLGEWYLNLNDGVPYPEGVVGVHSKETADQTLVAQILLVEGVTGLENWASTFDAETRAYKSIGATLYTAYGQTQLQISNLGTF